MLTQKLSLLSPILSRTGLLLNRPSVLTFVSQRTLVQSGASLRNSCLKTSREAVSCFPTVSFKGCPLYNAQSLRFYNRKKTIKIGPTKPLTFDYSGDLSTSLSAVDPTTPKPGYEEVDELKNAEKSVQEIFSMGFADGGEIKEKRLNAILSAIQEHPADVRSLEVKIARTTFLLRNQMHHVLQFRKDKTSKSLLVRRIHSRNRLMRQLRSHDMEKFEWLLKELKIKYVPEKTYVDFYQTKLSRRAQRKKTARDGFFAVKKEKLEKLRQKLSAERELFEKEKDEELSRIAKELEAMGIKEMDSVDSILTAIGMEQYIEKPEKRMKRRYLILQKKFEAHAEREKAKKLAEQSAV